MDRHLVPVEVGVIGGTDDSGSLVLIIQEMPYKSIGKTRTLASHGKFATSRGSPIAAIGNLRLAWSLPPKDDAVRSGDRHACLCCLASVVCLGFAIGCLQSRRYWAAFFNSMIAWAIFCLV